MRNGPSSPLGRMFNTLLFFNLLTMATTICITPSNQSWQTSPSACVVPRGSSLHQEGAWLFFFRSLLLLLLLESCLLQTHHHRLANAARLGMRFPTQSSGNNKSDVGILETLGYTCSMDRGLFNRLPQANPSLFMRHQQVSTLSSVQHLKKHLVVLFP